MYGLQRILICDVAIPKLPTYAAAERQTACFKVVITKYSEDKNRYCWAVPIGEEYLENDGEGEQ